jgi:hypothetical protein
VIVTNANILGVIFSYFVAIRCYTNKFRQNAKVILSDYVPVWFENFPSFYQRGSDRCFARCFFKGRVMRQYLFMKYHRAKQINR